MRVQKTTIVFTNFTIIAQGALVLAYYIQKGM